MVSKGSILERKLAFLKTMIQRFFLINWLRLKVQKSSTQGSFKNTLSDIRTYSLKLLKDWLARIYFSMENLNDPSLFNEQELEDSELGSLANYRGKITVRICSDSSESVF